MTLESHEQPEEYCIRSPEVFNQPQRGIMGACDVMGLGDGRNKTK